MGNKVETKDFRNKVETSNNDFRNKMETSNNDSARGLDIKIYLYCNETYGRGRYRCPYMMGWIVNKIRKK